MSQPRRTSEQMFPLIETYLASGQSQKAFCGRHNLSEAVLNYWLSKYRHNHSSEAFVEVRPEPIDTVFMEIAYPGGIRIRFFAPVSPSYLSELLRCEIA